MKSFLLACVAAVAITIIANVVLTGSGFSAQNATTSGDYVRVGVADYAAGTDD